MKLKSHTERPDIDLEMASFERAWKRRQRWGAATGAVIGIVVSIILGWCLTSL